MVKKVAFVILFLVIGFVLSFIVAICGFIINSTSISVGLPFKFSSFNFLGSETDTWMLLLDIIFWSLITFLSWVLLKKLFKR
jgi:hypothetical protein